MARNKIIPIFVPHLGCPHNCVFCNQNKISGADKSASGEDVLKAVDGYPDCQVAFYGGSFTAIPVEQQEELLSAAAGHSIRLSTRPDYINQEILDRLKYYHVDTIELGAQSMDDTVLKKSGRGHTADDVVKASMLIKNNGFNLILQMMTGLPADNCDKTTKTAKKIIELKPDGVRIYPTVVVKDTALYELFKTGKYVEHTVDDAVEWCSRIVPLFRDANIPIIRLGLNPTDDLSGGNAVAGAYHPALGELVVSRILRDELDRRIATKIEMNPDLCEITIEVPQRNLSQAIGQHRTNIDYLKGKYNLQTLKIVGYNN